MRAPVASLLLTGLLAARAAAQTAPWHPDARELAVAALADAARLDLAAMCARCGEGCPGDCGRDTGAALPPLRFDPVLAEAARFHARHMHDAPCFQHESCCTLERTAQGAVRCRTALCSQCGGPTSCPGTETDARYALLGYGYFSGENIAVGYPDAAAVVCGWLSSDAGHCANLRGSHDDLGVGLRDGPACMRRYWVQGFGARPDRRDPGYVAAAGLMDGAWGGAAPARATALAFLWDPRADGADEAAAPRSVQVVVDGRCAAMTRVVGSGGRGLWRASLDLDDGCHEAWFFAIDAAGRRHAFPGDGPLGPALAYGTGNLSCGWPATRTPAACEGPDACTEAGARRDCYPGPEGTRDVGLCHGGARVCRDGAFDACEGAVAPAAEACNGLDDDCDGITDDAPADEGGACDTGRPGRCRSGRLACAGGRLVCAAEAPAEETCDGEDDDCNGATDDGLGRVACGTGACARLAPACADGAPGACVPGTPAPAEICGNDLDDDCDGSPDQGCPCAGGARPCYPGPAGTLGVGLCQAGTQACAAGTWGSCTGAVLPVPESCNGGDDDCNGTADEGLGRAVCGTGACRVSMARCSGGRPQACAPLPPAEETCDGSDESCDGRVDETCSCKPGAQQPCYSASWTAVGAGVCRAGVRTCAADGRSFGPCAGEVLPAEEACRDGVDQDCDGFADDGCPPPPPPDPDPPRQSPGCGCGGGAVSGAALLLLALRRARARAPIRRRRS